MINRGQFVGKVAVFAFAITSFLSTNAFASPTDLFDTRVLRPFSQSLIGSADLFLAGLRQRVAISNVGQLDDFISGALPKAPKTVMPPVTRNSDFNVFGSVVIPVGKLPLATSWKRVAGRMALCADSCTKLGRRLTETASDAANLPVMAALQLVNRTVNNAITYRTDKALWGKADYWATPAQIIAKQSGDCEDYAIAKMALLRKAGFDESQLQLIVLKDVRKQVFHAVLAVHTQGGTYILDNMNNTVSSDVALRNYMPIMSFAAGKSFIHGFKDIRPEFASIGKNDLASAMPGEAF